MKKGLQIIGIIFFGFLALVGYLQRDTVGGENNIVLSVVSFVVVVLLFSLFKSNKHPLKETHRITPSKTLQTSASTLENISAEPATSYVEADGTIYRTDGKAFTDEDVPYLMQWSYEKAKNHEKTSNNPKFHRTEKEEELSFQFMMKYGSRADLLADEFQDLYRTAHQTKDLSMRISLLHKAIMAFEKAQKFCYSKGKGGTIYFQDMWEFMHNSQNECYSYLDNIMNSLAEAERKKDIIIPSILSIIKKNDGILQKDIYRLLPEISKQEVQSAIRDLESTSAIGRIKKSNSYELHVL